MKEAEVKVKSLQKALEVLDCFREKQPLGVTEISEKLGLYKSNVHNILMTFKAMDYLEQDEESGKFVLGTAIFGLSRALGDRYDISNIAVPYMRKICKEVNEVVYLAVPDKDEVIYLDAVYPDSNYVGAPSVRGDRSKMYCTSIGKAILSMMPENEREECISEELEAFTEYTITNREQLKQELQLTKERGYAFDNMEGTFGVKCVGVPVLNRSGQVIAGISISTPSLRMGEEKVLEFVKVLKKNVKEMEKKL